MKNLFFHLMPYKGLPDDFVEKYGSVWVDIDATLYDHEIFRENMNDYLDQLRFADQLGFDGICVNEHHSNGYAIMSSPQMMATVLARETTNAAIVLMGCSIALYDPPQRVAEDMATIDALSDGRLVAGFPLGTPFDTVYAMGQNPSSVRQKYQEAYEIIMRCWASNEMFAHNGNYYKQPFINPFVKPKQRPHPPIWVPGGGSVDTWRFAAENNYGYGYTSFYGAQNARTQVEGFWDMVDEAGQERNPFRLGMVQFIGVAASREEAFELYREPAEYLYNRNLKVSSRWAVPPGYQSEETKRMQIQSTMQQAALKSVSAIRTGGLTMEEIVERGYVIIGSPDEVAAQIRQNCIDLNCGNMMALLQFGNMRTEVGMYNLELYGRYVKPQLDDLFEKEWEHLWWPEACKATRSPPTGEFPRTPAFAAEPLLSTTLHG
jgi:alkanesulfonate monooxygenase SsuD/methylene tetrahydromethanopterin reductase-like flavin-dependent oxidoreductase (luciferase family)